MHVLMFLHVAIVTQAREECAWESGIAKALSVVWVDYLLRANGRVAPTEQSRVFGRQASPFAAQV